MKKSTSAIAASIALFGSVVSAAPSAIAADTVNVTSVDTVCNFKAGSICSTTFNFDGYVIAWANPGFTLNHPSLGVAALDNATRNYKTKTLKFKWRVNKSLVTPASLSIASWRTQGYITPWPSGPRLTMPLSVVYTKSATSSTAPSAPSAPTVTGSTGTTVSLSWPAPFDGGSPISKYEVVSGGVVVATTTDTSVTISNLLPATLYGYTVRAVNSVGTSPSSPSTSVTTPADVPFAPTSPAVSNLSGVGMTLSWLPPVSDGGMAIEGYEVYNGATLLGTTAGTSMALTGLAPNTNYNFSVRAINAKGRGPALAIPAATPVTVPSAPLSPVVSDLTSTGLTLTWGASLTDGGMPITSYQVFRNGVLQATTTGTYTVITGLSPASSHVFTVKAVNMAGASADSAPTSATTLPDVPSAPVDLAASAVTATTLTLSWNPPTTDNGSAVSVYQVYRNGVFLEATTATTVNVANLTPATAYTYTVKAVNTVGASLASNLVSVSTLSAPPSAPGTPVVTNLAPTSLTLSWPVPDSENGSPISGYEVYTNGELLATSVAPTVALTGLTPATLYSLTVKAVNGVGSSAASSAVSATTPADVPSAPTGLKVENLTSTGLFLSWDIPAKSNGSAITGYRVFDGGVLVATTAVASWTATNLGPNTAHTYTVTAVNGIGESVASASISATTPASAPSAPGTPTATVTGARSVTITWAAPSSDGGVGLSGYEIYVGGVLAGTTTDTTFTATGLTPVTAYSFTVKAVNSVGSSAASGARLVTTVADVPDPVTNLSAVGRSTGVVALGWNAPLKNNGSTIIGYKIYKNGDYVGQTSSVGYQVAGLALGTSYEFTVKAVNAMGESAGSVTTGTTLTVNPIIPIIESAVTSCGFADQALCTTTLSFSSNVTVWGNLSFTTDNPLMKSITLSNTAPKTNTKTVVFTWRVNGLIDSTKPIKITGWTPSTAYISKSTDSTKKVTLDLIEIWQGS